MSSTSSEVHFCDMESLDFSSQLLSLVRATVLNSSRNKFRTKCLPSVLKTAETEYDIRDILGRGGEGVVYRVRVKRILPARNDSSHYAMDENLHANNLDPNNRLQAIEKNRTPDFGNLMNSKSLEITSLDMSHNEEICESTTTEQEQVRQKEKSSYVVEPKERAMKVVISSSQAHSDAIRREVDLLQKFVDCPNVVQLVDHHWSPSATVILMELADGDFGAFLKKEGFSYYSELLKFWCVISCHHIAVISLMRIVMVLLDILCIGIPESYNKEFEECQRIVS